MDVIVKDVKDVKGDQFTEKLIIIKLFISFEKSILRNNIGIVLNV